MSHVVVINSVTLDGVMQGPGRAGEDTREGFRFGGWAVSTPRGHCERNLYHADCRVWTSWGPAGTR
jgi:hypothetical protein